MKYKSLEIGSKKKSCKMHGRIKEKQYFNSKTHRLPPLPPKLERKIKAAVLKCWRENPNPGMQFATQHYCEIVLAYLNHPSLTSNFEIYKNLMLASEFSREEWKTARIPDWRELGRLRSKNPGMQNALIGKANIRSKWEYSPQALLECQVSTLCSMRLARKSCNSEGLHLNFSCVPGEKRTVPENSEPSRLWKYILKPIPQIPGI